MILMVEAIQEIAFLKEQQHQKGKGDLKQLNFFKLFGLTRPSASTASTTAASAGKSARRTDSVSAVAPAE